MGHSWRMGYVGADVMIEVGRMLYIIQGLDQTMSVWNVSWSLGAVSSPGISLAGIHKASSGVMLDCRSEGWYPEPEVLWLDGEGNLLSAGPTETVRGPDDLYTVSSRVTVEKRHSNSFTCRVQQKNINQTRETHIHVPGRNDFYNNKFQLPTHETPTDLMFSVQH